MSAKRPVTKRTSRKAPRAADSLKFEPVKIDSLFEGLDAVAWIGEATCAQVAQFAGIDPRTAGKVLKNAVFLGLLDYAINDIYILRLPYPYKGTLDEKQAVAREALVRMPVLKNMRQFLRLGETTDNALRKAATVSGIQDYNPQALVPLINWARTLGALDPGIDIEVLVDQATEAKQDRRVHDASKRVAFISHSAKDKPFVRKLAADLTAAGVNVWLDEQHIRVGDSIPERVGQGLATSDVFLIALSTDSVASEWVKRELNSALINEISKRKVKVMPLKLSDCLIPEIIQDKKFADFTQSYKLGFDELLTAIQALET